MDHQFAIAHGVAGVAVTTTTGRDLERGLSRKRMAAPTCPAVVQHAITSGLRSMAPFQIAREA